MPEPGQIAEKEGLDYIGKQIHGSPEERIAYHKMSHRHTKQQSKIIYPVYAPLRVADRFIHGHKDTQKKTGK